MPSWSVAPLILAAAMTAAVTPAASIELPFEFTTRQPIVRVRVNGGEPVPFVVDTGATIHLIDADLVSKLGVKTQTPPGAGQISGGGQGSVAIQTVDGLTFAVGATSWANQRRTVCRWSVSRLMPAQGRSRRG